MPSQQEEEKVNIGYRGTESHRRQLQIEALRRGMKVQNLIDAAVAFYLDRKPVKILQEERVAAKG